MPYPNPCDGHGFRERFALNRPTLDINVVHHCNLRCANCSHGSPFAKKYVMGLDVLERDLTALKPYLHVGELLIVGGEPLLRKDLPEVLEICRKSDL